MRARRRIPAGPHRARGGSVVMRKRFDEHLHHVARALLRLIVAAAVSGLALTAVAAPSIDTIVVRLRDDAASAGRPSLAKVDSTALATALRLPFSIVDHTREGGFVLQLATSVSVDSA